MTTDPDHPGAERQSLFGDTGSSPAGEQLRLAAKVFETSGEAITITDSGARIVSVNAAFEKVTGYSAAEVLGCNPRLLKSGRHGRDFYEEMWACLHTEGRWHGEIWNRRKSGEIYPEWLTISAVSNADGEITHYVGSFSDISERKEAQDKIEFLAFHDPLTHLPNRLLGKDRARQAVAYAERNRTHTAVLCLDLDHFKLVNDSLGHAAGDALLGAVALRLQECLRETDVLSRLSGDEFLVVLQDVRGNDAIASICEKILLRLADPFAVDGHDLATSFSIGVAVYPQDGLDAETLLKHADTALFKAKEGGRNTYRFFNDAMNSDAVEHLFMREGLRRAVERGEFVLHYQPQIGLGKRMIGAEALVRWNHPELGLLPPQRFIPTAEETGLIVPIGEWVLREACRQAVAWQQAGIADFVMAVNLSAVQFKRGDLAQTVASVLAETGLDPARLELELTESTLIQDTESALATLHRLKALGIKLSIDDFGTGYSSLSYLKRFNVDKLKIDQSFIRNLGSDPDDAAIITAIVQMAKGLSLKTIAEGVETEGMLTRLHELGCHEWQGYHFARPLPAEEFIAYVKAQLPA